MSRRPAALLVWLLTLATAQADTFTNLAGETITGQIVTITNGLLTLRAEHGMIQSFSLNDFSSRERERFLLAAGQTPPLPADLQQRYDYLRDLCQRARQQEQAGLQTKEETARRLLELRALWQQTLDAALAADRISAPLHAHWLPALLE